MNSLSKSRILPPHSHEDHSNTVSPLRESRCSRITVSGFAIRKGSFCIDRKSNHLPVYCRTIPAGNTVYNKPALTENPRFLNIIISLQLLFFPVNCVPEGSFMQEKLCCLASAAFGLEGLVAGELRELGMSDVKTENGCVRFLASVEQLFLCNLKMHFSERVFIVAAEKTCTSFEELFCLVSSVPWQDYADGHEAFNVSAKCVRSRLMSPSDCQSITKKAIIEKLKKTRHLSRFPEDGPPLPVVVSVHSDLVRILINTSGDALSRRGYRTWNGEAPLRETLASALVHLSPWNRSLPLYDPCCGTGTILIEAALKAEGAAPGIHRSFAMEQFFPFRSFPFAEIRRQVYEECTPDIPFSVRGSDIDPDAIELSHRHIRQAKLNNRVYTEILPLQQVNLAEPSGVFICNPPYGERLSDQKSCRALYRDLRALKNRHPGWSMCVITSDPAFEKVFGLRASRKRRLYNGRLECTYYIFD